MHGRLMNIDADGDRDRKRTTRPESEWLRVQVPHLRIVPEGLAEAVDARRASMLTRSLRQSNGRLMGRPPGEGSPYLLTGLLTCGVCGGGMEVLSTTSGKRRTFHYRCYVNRRKGSSVCANKLAAPMADADAAVLREMKKTLLHPAVIERALAHAERSILRQRSAGEREPVEAELADVKKAMRRLSAAIAKGGELDTLVAALATHERQRAELESKVEALLAPHLTTADASCPLWDKTVADIFEDDDSLITYFDRYVGYSLTGDCREESLALCYGDGANGKGTLMNTLGWLFGDYADDLPFSAFELSGRGGLRTTSPRLLGSDSLQLKEVLVFSSHYFQTRDNIAADKHLTPDGKSASRRKAAEPIIGEIAKWKDKRLGALDADIASSRAALLPASTEQIEPRRIDTMLWHLRDHTAEERATFYNSATDAERLVMEAASASVGRMPVKTPQGLVWETILDSQLVNDAVLARAQAKNPAAAAKLAELQEIRDMHATAANIAIAEIRDTLNG